MPARLSARTAPQRHMFLRHLPRLVDGADVGSAEKSGDYGEYNGNRREYKGDGALSRLRSGVAGGEPQDGGCPREGRREAEPEDDERNDGEDPNDEAAQAGSFHTRDDAPEEDNSGHDRDRARDEKIPRGIVVVSAVRADGNEDDRERNGSHCDTGASIHVATLVSGLEHQPESRRGRAQEATRDTRRLVRRPSVVPTGCDLNADPSPAHRPGVGRERYATPGSARLASQGRSPGSADRNQDTRVH